jgi:uncharacterized protein YcbK (DUF882 family)
MGKCIKYGVALICAAMSVLIFASRLETAALHESTFGLTGDGRVAFIDTHNGERVSVVYRTRDGRYDDSALAAIDYVLRCHGGDEQFPISLKLIELVDHIQDNFGANDVRIISGYRSPKYNAWLRRRSRRVAHDSLHMRGMAMDIRMDGVNKHKLGRFVRGLHAGGVGVYRRSGFVHVDVGPARLWATE